MLMLIHGDNRYDSLKRLGQLSRDYGSAVLTVSGDTITDAAEIFKATDTFSMFSPKQLTIVKRFNDNPKKATLVKAIIAKLEMSGSADFDLIFWEDHDLDVYKYSRPKKTTAVRPSGRISLYSYLKQHAKVERFEPLSLQRLKQWLGELLQEEGITNAGIYLEQILARTGADQFLLASEAAKLSLYLKAQGRNSIQPADLELITVYDPESSVWALTDAFCSRDKTRALKLLDQMLTGPEAYPLIFSVLEKQLKQLYLTKMYGQQRTELMQALALKPYTYSKLWGFAQRFTTESIRTLFTKLLDLDYSVKQGKIEIKLGLDLLVATL